MRKGLPLFAIGLVLVLGLTASALADYTLVGKIPAPQPCPQSCPVTGLASAGENLFATVVYDTISFTYLLRPSDGMMLDMYAWVRGPGQDNYYYFDGAAYEAGLVYWVTDINGADLIRFEFDDGFVAVIDTIHSDRITAPSGLAWQDMSEAYFDALWVTDSEWDSLFLVETTGAILEAYSLSDIPFIYSLNPTSVTREGENLFFTSGAYADSLFESTVMASRVDAHYLPDLSQMDPLATTFHDGLLYVGGYGDSILIYSTGSYRDSVPAGDSIIVHVIPDELDVGFAHVDSAGSLYVEVTSTQSCPPPEDVNFFGDYYDISTTATFSYITKVALTEVDDFPPGVRTKDVRVFVRPSGECQTWRDITVDMVEVEGQTFARLGKRLSEDDEFSVFTFAEDLRPRGLVIELKFDYLDSAITQNQSSIPPEEYASMHSFLSAARLAYGLRRYGLAARGVDRIADIAMNTPEIPHTYDPDDPPGSNVAGRIISRAHTLSFSLRLMLQEKQIGSVGPAPKTPDINIIGDSGPGDAPAGFAVVPNPSQAGFTISFAGSGRHPVSVKIYTVEGQLVKTLVAGDLTEGARSVVWDGRNEDGMSVVAGTYFAVLAEGEQTSIRKLVLRR